MRKRKKNSAAKKSVCKWREETRQTFFQSRRRNRLNVLDIQTVLSNKFLSHLSHAISHLSHAISHLSHLLHAISHLSHLSHVMISISQHIFTCPTYHKNISQAPAGRGRLRFHPWLPRLDLVPDDDDDEDDDNDGGGEDLARITPTPSQGDTTTTTTTSATWIPRRGSITIPARASSSPPSGQCSAFGLLLRCCPPPPFSRFFSSPRHAGVLVRPFISVNLEYNIIFYEFNMGELSGVKVE